MFIFKNWIVDCRATRVVIRFEPGVNIRSAIGATPLRPRFLIQERRFGAGMRLTIHALNLTAISKI